MQIIEHTEFSEYLALEHAEEIQLFDNFSKRGVSPILEFSKTIPFIQENKLEICS